MWVGGVVEYMSDSWYWWCYDSRYDSRFVNGLKLSLLRVHIFILYAICDLLESILLSFWGQVIKYC